MYWFYDATYILVLIGAAICIAASINVKATYSRYARISSLSGMTGAQAAQKILHQMGIYDVHVEYVSGTLNDHYDPRSKTLRLSDAVYGSSSVAALGVAAHECGHAAQHANGYLPLIVRSKLVPAANIGCRFGLPIVVLGVIFGGAGSTLAMVGVIVFAVSVLFQIVTLPVEFNASRRGMAMLADSGMLRDEELRKCRKVLGAAALTYVAAAASSILQLLRLLIIANGGNRRRD